MKNLRRFSWPICPSASIVENTFASNRRHNAKYGNCFPMCGVAVNKSKCVDLASVSASR